MSSHSIPNRNSGTNPTSRNGVTPGSPGSPGVNHPNAPQPATPPCPLEGEPMTNLQRRLVCKQIALDPTRRATERIAALKLDFRLAEAEAKAKSQGQAQPQTSRGKTVEPPPPEDELMRVIRAISHRPGPAEGVMTGKPAAAPPPPGPGGHSNVTPGAPSVSTPPAASAPPPTGAPAGSAATQGAPSEVDPELRPVRHCG